MPENNPSENEKESEEVPGLPPIFSVEEARELASRAYELLSSKRSNDAERAEVCEVAGKRGDYEGKLCNYNRFDTIFPSFFHRKCAVLCWPILRKFEVF
jgi:hypothetical protein